MADWWREAGSLVLRRHNVNVTKWETTKKGLKGSIRMWFLWTFLTLEHSCFLSRTLLWSMLKLVALGDNSKYLAGQYGPASLHSSSSLSPSPSWLHWNVVFSENVCFLRWSLSSAVCLFAVWNVICVCTEFPLSHSGLFNLEHLSLRSPSCLQWLGKPGPTHPTNV